MAKQNSCPSVDLSLNHLHAELARLDIRLDRAVRLWQRAGQDPGNPFRGLSIADEEASALLTRVPGSTWGDTVTLPPPEAESLAAREATTLQTIEKIVARAQEQGQRTRLHHLARAFNLDRFSLDLFLIALAPALDLRYQRLYAYLQDDATRKVPRLDLALSLLCNAPADRWQGQLAISPEATLLKYRLLTLGEPADNYPYRLDRPLLPDPAVVAWLLGEYRSPAEFGPWAALSWPAESQRDPAKDSSPLAQALVAEPAPLIAFYGPDRLAQLELADSLAGHLKRPLLMVDLSPILDRGCPPSLALRLALRDAHMTTALPILQDWDDCLVDGAVPGPLFQELCAYPGPVIVAGRDRWQPGGIERQRPLRWQAFPIPTYQQRRRLWRSHLSAQPADLDDAVSTLAGQFALTSGQIRDAVATARDAAAQRGTFIHADDLFAAARAHSSLRLSHLARKITPRYDWGDLIMPPEQLAMLREIVDTVRSRPQVLDGWGVGRKLAGSAAVTILFAGPPGTGKTMAAEVLARTLQLDLYTIDLSGIISKYVGETEKNLEKIFDEAQSSNAILFFDEADAIFGKRSQVKDARDRYANIEVSYLLQRMENYDGVTILATNLRANLDEAFTRRMHFIIDVPFPDEVYRRRIWETLFPPDLPRAADLDLAWMADRFKLAGGNIRNVIVSAAYLAAANGGTVTMDHLLHGVRREMQKMGRLVSNLEAQFEPVEDRKRSR